MRQTPVQLVPERRRSGRSWQAHLRPRVLGLNVASADSAHGTRTTNSTRAGRSTFRITKHVGSLSTFVACLQTGIENWTDNLEPTLSCQAQGGLCGYLPVTLSRSLSTPAFPEERVALLLSVSKLL